MKQETISTKTSAINLVVGDLMRVRKVSLSLSDSINERMLSEDTYEERALNVMEEQNAFSGQSYIGIAINEEYVTREAIISCSLGTRHTKLGLCEDHGIIATNQKPLMTCEDCKIFRNISSFDRCKGNPPTIDNLCIPMITKAWIQQEGRLYIFDVTENKYVDALRSSAYLTCRYGGLITVKEVPAEDALEDKFIIIDDWLYLYYNPTVLDEGRSVPKHKDANNYDWAMPEELRGKPTEDWFETKSPAYNEITKNGGKLIVVMTNNNLYTDTEGRYWVAVGPNVMNPNHPKIQVEYDLDSSEMNYGTKIDIVVEGEDGTIYYIPAVVGDAKEHSYPDGVYQTGIPFNKNRASYPDTAGNTVEFIGCNITQIPNGTGGTKSSINITNNYKLVEIIVYDGVFNYE